MKDTSFVVECDTDGKDLSPLSTAAWDLVPRHLVLEIWTTPASAIIYINTA